MTNRSNQDEYDVIQAKEEFESMLDPRTAALQIEIERLKQRVIDAEEQNEELRDEIEYLYRRLRGEISE